MLPLTRPAIAFTYFEALLRVGDGQRFADEEGRLLSMANLLENIGYHRDIWIDFAEEAYELLVHLEPEGRQRTQGAAPGPPAK